MSRSKYIQGVGRVIRPFPAPEKLKEMEVNGEVPEWVKDYAIVLDFCDLTAKHSIITLGSVFGMGSKFNFQGKLATKAAKNFQQELSKLDEKHKEIAKTVEVDSIEELQALVKRVDLLKPPEVSSEVRKFSTLDWHKMGGEGHEIALTNGEVIRVVQDAIGNWEIKRSVKGIIEHVDRKHSLENAILTAEQKCIPESEFDLLRANAKWKQKRPSEDQCKYLYNISPEIRKNFSGKTGMMEAMKWIQTHYSSGQVSTLIQEALGKRN